MPEELPPGHHSGSEVFSVHDSANGSGGQYVFADLAEIDGIIAELEALVAEVQAEDETYARAIGLAVPPAEDFLSVEQADAYVAALEKGRTHNKAMSTYADDLLADLRAARQAYADGDATSAAQLRSAGESGS